MTKDNQAWALPQMVRWYNVPQLSRTGLSVVLSTILGEMLDSRRIINSQANVGDCVFDCGSNEETNSPFWFDYMADTGDGWVATYTMAYLLSKPALTESGASEPLPRGRFLVLGGDQVYPVASKEAYATRLVWPFNEAKRTLEAARGVGKAQTIDGDPPALFAIPGNHDWYDGLESFTRRICSGRRLGDFRTLQKRSYFVLKLPHLWELWGIDLQLRHDLDVPQLEFFTRHAENSPPGAKIILCAAEPAWVFGAEAKDRDFRFNLDRVRKLAEQQGKVVLDLAGDIHNYQRYVGEPDANGQRRCTIVSGGGGAFLHPTHGFADQATTASRETLTCKERYPSEATSSKLTWGNAYFPYHNPEMVGVLGVAYLAMFGMTHPAEGRWADVLNFPLHHPWAALLVAFFVWMFVRFADAATSGRKLAMGGLHAAAHLGVALFAVGVGRWVASWPLWVGEHAGAYAAIDWPTLAFAVSVVLVGGLLGAFLFGWYLLFSLNVLRTHHNEAFSGLRVGDYKHFLRFKLSPDELKVFVVGIDKLPRSIPSPGVGKTYEPPTCRPKVVEEVVVFSQTDASANVN